MILLNIIWPTFALVALIFVVWATLVVRRLAHIKRTPPGREDFASGTAAQRYFEPVELPANNLANLFEMPVLYFALVPLLILTQQTSVVQIVLAWAFVLLRATHSVIHTGRNNVRARFFIYLASVAVLMAMWVGFFIDIAGAAHAYTEAMRGIVRQP